MKRIITVLICLLAVASLSVSVLALGSVQMTLTADKTTVCRGDTVAFTISVPEVTCRSGGFVLDGKYDADVFEFVEGHGHLQDVGDVEASNKEDLPAGFSNVGFISDKLSGSFMYTDSDAKVSGAIFVIKMRVKTDAELGTTTVAPIVMLRDANGDITTTINALDIKIVCNHNWSDWSEGADGIKTRVCSVCGEVQSLAGVAGDLDENGVVNEDDAIYLFMYAMTEDADTYPVNQPIDYDKNGVVNEDDAIYLFMYAMTEDEDTYPIT